jgi:hypothetical protein
MIRGHSQNDRQTGFDGEKYTVSDVHVELSTDEIRNLTKDETPNLQPDWRP